MDRFSGPPAPGQSTRLMRNVDYILIGAMKCGTTTLASQLAAQAGVFMTTPKEPNYFSDDDVFALGQDWYGALFNAAAPGDLCGEASTHYTKRPDYPQTIKRMQDTLEAPRLIYMIRDPMARLVSHYVHAWSEGWTTDPLEKAINTLPQLVDYGRYGWQIAPFVEAFGQDAILLTSLERQKSDPDGELARIAQHIGLTSPVRWQQDIGAQNVSAERVRKLPLHGLLVDHPFSTALRRALVPKALRTRIRDARKMADRPTLPEAVRPALEDRFAQDRIALAAAFPNDPSLNLAYPFLDPL